MHWIRAWKLPFSILTSVICSLLGLESSATTATPPAPTPLMAQKCSYGEKPKPYARIATQQGNPVNVRSSPNGPVIGSIPNGWAIVRGKTDTSGRWVEIKSHFSSPNSRYAAIEESFASAPNFRNGWVAARYLKSLGKFCDKPQHPVSSLKLNLFNQRELELQSNWLQRGDRISRKS